MADKIVEGNRQFPVSGALNSFSPRSSSFTVPVMRERFINPFFRLLDSPNKSVEMF
jgi:hypothetical protein